MKLPNDFQFYIKQGIVRKISPDLQRAKFLINESEMSFNGLIKRVNLMGIDDETTNSIIKDCYDIILEMIRAKMFLEGYSSSGNYAHESEISFLKEKGFNEIEISFVNELRYFRNSITYYGKILDKEYGKKVFGFLKNFYPKLKKTIIFTTKK